MANTVKLKRSSVASKVPTTSDLQLGELAINTYDGKLYTKKDNGTASIVEIGAGGAGVTDGDKGDITVSGSGATWTIDAGAVSSTKLGGDITTAGKALLTAADAAAQRTALAAAGTGVTNTFTASQIIEVTDNTNAALRITQLGTGHAIRVEDSTNPDSTPFVVTAAGDVGIGTTAPGALLSVNGIASFGAGAAATPSIAAFGDLNTGMWFPAADTIAWSTGGSERMRITNGGFIGIGTSVPDAAIDIRSSAAFQPQILLFNTTENAFGPYWNSQKLRGTSPANSGDVLGNFMFRSTDTSGAIQNACYIEAISQGAGAGFHSGRFQFNTFGASGTFGVRLLVLDQGILVPQGSAALPSVAMYDDPDTGTWFPALNTYAISTGGTERMRIDSSGKVGIGTTSPQKRFVVSNSGAVGLEIDPTGRSGETATSLLSYNRSGAAFVPAQYDASEHQFLTSTTERMRIDSSGNVGLGVTPSAWANARAYQVGLYAAYAQRTAGTSDISMSWNATITSGNSSGTGYVYRITGDLASAYEQNGAHRWYTAPSGTAGTAITFTQAMTLDTNGNLGIGTTSPVTRLDVASGSAVLAANFNSTNASGVYVRFQNSGTAIGDLGSGGNLFAGGTAGDFGLTSRSGNLVFGTSSTERMRIDSSGNVGIGTSNPAGWTAKFAAVGSVLSGGQNYVAAFSDGVNSTLRIGQQSGITNLVTDTALALYTSNTERMRIDASGNVNIGADAGNTLRYLDVSNGNTGASAGAIIRLVTSNAAGSGNVAVDIVKYKNGTFVINNNETNSAAFTSFGVGASERMRIGASGQLGIGGANYGTSGQLLTSGGASAAPSWTTVQGVTATTGSAAYYGARAWVNFNGTGTVSIRNSVNVSSITDHGTGDYSVNFTTAMADADYCACMNGSQTGGTAMTRRHSTGGAPTASAFRFSSCNSSNNGQVDDAFCYVAIYR